MSELIPCPICSREVPLASINRHIDQGCPDETVPSTPVSGFFAGKAKGGTSQSASSTAGTTRQVTFTSSPAKDSKETTTQGKRLQSAPLQDSAEIEDESASSSAPAAKRQKMGASSSSAAIMRAAMPLAERMRPTELDNIFGQDLVGPDGILRRMIEQDDIKSMILWGSPGCGKTTVARTIATLTKARFVELSGTTNNVQDCKKIFAEAKAELQLLQRKTILFIDEIHRFTKTQQDIFLAPVESGQITLIGATTENPSFKIQSALLSRCRVYTLKPLSTGDVIKIIERALSHEFPDITLRPALLDAGLASYLAEFASGDARTALNLLELSIQLASRSSQTAKPFTKEDLKKALTRTLVYDRQGDGHYDTISAFHKSVRGSDPDAALYYLGRMIESGEDPLFISRRMMVMASEDIGLADNSLLSLATATHFAVQNVGMPEARINMAHCAVALSLAKKSTRAYRGLNNVMALLGENPEAASTPIPLHLRNAPTKLMKSLGYGKEYKYNPNYVDGIVQQEYLPTMLLGKKFLEPNDLGTQIDEEALQNDIIEDEDAF